ncbi:MULTISPECIES: MarR family transcriptional regulator [unclassified Chelatococcus]|uniref:MarR family winged helix-turn-helix transcriptional regulator n=1 Tax=unclassified Chelatococcus TaxID=2638111 RepID=UPI001BD0BB3A|nr:MULTISPECIES: MarR family transcriptional regulator [unclassified Chelatococcus]MBS7697691.1 MarR family transcriptional regulator [Chelatococcus sp. YT9]MBX3558452.1 MarR family transcriptional regulator [Chelatococcus sp.]
MSVLPSQERNRLGSLLGHAARQWRRAVDRRLQPFDLTEATWLPLLRIARAPHPMYQKDLAASLSLDRSSVVRLLDSLQRAGLVERREGRDRRTKAIVLTALGHATVQRVEVFARDVREVALADIAPEDLATTMRVLDHIATVLSPSSEEIVA